MVCAVYSVLCCSKPRKCKKCHGRLSPAPHPPPPPQMISRGSPDITSRPYYNQNKPLLGSFSLMPEVRVCLRAEHIYLVAATYPPPPVISCPPPRCGDSETTPVLLSILTHHIFLFRKRGNTMNSVHPAWFLGQVQMETNVFGCLLIRALSCPHLDTARTSSRG